MGGVEEEWLRLGSRLRVMGFEPDAREFAKLSSDARHLFLNCALAATSGTPLSFYVSREAGKSSVLQPNMELLRQFPDAERYETVHTSEISGANVKTLDQVLSENPAWRPDFIKLDTQGSEKMILEGGKKALETSVFGLKVEVEFVPLYMGQPLFADVDAFLRPFDFELIDLRRAFWKRKAFTDFSGKGSLVFGDALYFKNERGIRTLLETKSPDGKLQSLLRYILICTVYGAYDYAFYLMDTFAAHDPSHLFHAIRAGLKTALLKGQFGKSYRLSTVFGHLQRRTAKSHLGFADGDATLGN